MLLDLFNIQFKLVFIYHKNKYFQVIKIILQIARDLKYLRSLKGNLQRKIIYSWQFDLKR